MLENGIMYSRLIRFVLQYINKFVRQFVIPEDALCIMLDEHASREEKDWSRNSKELGCEVLQAQSKFYSHALKMRKKHSSALRAHIEVCCAHPSS